MESASLTEKIVPFETEGIECQFCKAYNGESTLVKDWLKKPIAHLVVTIAEDGSTHVHGPVDDEKMMTRLIDIAMANAYRKSKEPECKQK